MAHETAGVIASRRVERGSVTLVSLCLTMAMGIALTSYLALCTRSNQMATRVLHQEKARELAQVGLEEALWALNEDQWTGSGPAGTTAWTTAGSNRSTTLTYSLPGPDASGQVSLTVTNYASAGPAWPSITSTATVRLQSGQIFTKTLQAATGPVPLFGNAIASSESYVSFVAGGTVDSWNSDPDNNPATPAVPYSFTAGNPTNYNAVIAARGNGNYGVMLAQATVCGYVATFGLPVSYSTSGSPIGRVIGPTTPVAVNVDPSRLGKSAFVSSSPVFDVSPPPPTHPNNGGLVGSINGLLGKLLGNPPNIDVYRIPGDLVILGIPLLSPNLVVDQPLTLLIDGDLNISTFGQITITATGSLKIFVAGDVTIGGLGFKNDTKEPKKLALFCSSASTSDSLVYNTAVDFCGVIYCENKPIDIQKNATFYGALLSRQSVKFTGTATSPLFHYDTALRQVRFSYLSTPYLIKNVTEL